MPTPPAPVSVRGRAPEEPPLDWILMERVGKGNFGSVYRGVHATTGEDLAVKIIDLEDACVGCAPRHAAVRRLTRPPSEDEVAEIQKEIAVLAQCRSPHVTRYIGARLELRTRLLACCLTLVPPPQARGLSRAPPSCAS